MFWVTMANKPSRIWRRGKNYFQIKITSEIQKVIQPFIANFPSLVFNLIINASEVFADVIANISTRLERVRILQCEF